MEMNTYQKITQTANEVRDLLLSKNEAYGDSALNPANIFFRAMQLTVYALGLMTS